MSTSQIGHQRVLVNADVALDIPVRFAETDLMGVVHHSVYAVWLEAGRVAWMEAAGMPYAEVAGGGHHFAVTGLALEYRASARFGDVVSVLTRLDSLRSRQVSFGYEVRNAGNGTLLATATSDHVCVDLDGQVTRIPSDVVARMRSGEEALANGHGAKDWSKGGRTP